MDDITGDGLNLSDPDGGMSPPLGEEAPAGPLTFSVPVGEQAVAPLVMTAPLPRGAGVTTPRMDGAEDERLLAEANRQARSASLTRLARYFPGYDFAAAAQNTDDRRYTLQPVSLELLELLDGPRTVDRLISDKEHSFGMTGVTFSHADLEGHQPPPPGVARATGAARSDTGHLVVGGLAAAVGQQWTTILNGIDRFDAGCASLCDDLTRAYGARINTNVYVSCGRAGGFGEHWDSHDTIIVQVHGTKEWSVFEPLVLSAQRPWIDGSISDRPVAAGVLEPGMALIIPRGWGHQVHDSDDLTIHYTIGVNRLEVHQLLDRVGWEVGFWPLLRADVPYDRRDAISSYGGSAFDHPGAFASLLGQVATDDLVDRAIASYRARVLNRLFPSLVDTFRALRGDWEGLAVRMPVPCGVGLVNAVDGGGETLDVAFNNVAVRLWRGALAAFAELASGEPAQPSQLPAVTAPGADSGDGRSRLVHELVAVGLAEVVPA